MNTKNKYVWKLHSGANWYLRDVAETLPYLASFVAVGWFLSWLVNVG